MSSVAPGSENPVQGLDRSVAVIAATSAECLLDVAEIDEQKLWERDGATSMTSWLAARYSLGRGTAQEWVRVAHALRGLPRIARAYARGEISWDQLQPLTKFATPETDELWAMKAPNLRPSGLWREARRHERVRNREAADIHQRRYLSLWWDPGSPVLYLEGMLGADQGAALQTALERRSVEIVLAEPPESSPQEARMADALVELVTGGDAEQAPPATVVVHAGAEVLTGEEPDRGPWLAETEAGTRLCTDAVRRLACDARIEWVLEREGRVVGIGRRGRQVPGAVGRMLRHRDVGCRFPGCERKRWVQAHHLVHWADGGATNLDNLMLLCHAHHRLIHEGGWGTSGHPARDLRFHDPSGRPLKRAAPQRELLARAANAP
jgi:hypothetical protein